MRRLTKESDQLVMSKRHGIMMFFILIFILNFILGCGNKFIGSDRDNKLESPQKAMAVEPRKSEPNKEVKKDSISENNINQNTNQGEDSSNKKSFIRKSSGIVTSVPWENNAEFKNAQKKNDTYVMMAAYCTVLPDPLSGEEENVHIGAKMLMGTVVAPGKIFSQNETIGPYTQAHGYRDGPTYIGSHITTTTGGGVCKIATTLYNVAVMSNLQIIERHAHGMPVSYVPYGQDATVSYGELDFRFKNNTEYPILIWTQSIDNILYIGLYGKKRPPKIHWHHEVSEVKKTKKIYNINSKLPAGTERLIVIGADGAKVKSWITIEQEDGSITTRQLRESIYFPLPYIYEKGR